MRALVLGLAFISTPVAAAEQQQFDLICQSPGGTVTYRIDLARSEYCLGDCQRVMKIAEVTSGMLVLEREEDPGPRGKRSSVEINRLNGEWHTYLFNPSFDTIPFVRDGTCNPKPFSGMPTPKF